MLGSIFFLTGEEGHNVLDLHATPCVVPCCLWHSKCNRYGVARGCRHRTFVGDRRVPDYGLHGPPRVVLCGINGTRDLVVQLKGKAPANG